MINDWNNLHSRDHNIKFDCKILEIVFIELEKLHTKSKQNEFTQWTVSNCLHFCNKHINDNR